VEPQSSSFPIDRSPAPPANEHSPQRNISEALPDTWAAPVIDGRPESAIGDSVIAGFVEAHTPTDVLRELVQNEYDAHGTKLSVTFLADYLRIVGNGDGVDPSGWARLGLLMGTGRAIGSSAPEKIIRPKENGIGSKNFGLSITHWIHMTASGGFLAVLKVRAGRSSPRTPCSALWQTERRPGLAHSARRATAWFIRLRPCGHGNVAFLLPKPRPDRRAHSCADAAPEVKIALDRRSTDEAGATLNAQ
jgi:hypothetical protein